MSEEIERRPRLLRKFRSSRSGMWYDHPASAGWSIDAVELHGKILVREKEEPTIVWIRRVAEWAERIHATYPGANRVQQ